MRGRECACAIVNSFRTSPPDMPMPTSVREQLRERHREFWTDNFLVLVGLVVYFGDQSRCAWPSVAPWSIQKWSISRNFTTNLTSRMIPSVQDFFYDFKMRRSKKDFVLTWGDEEVGWADIKARTWCSHSQACNIGRSLENGSFSQTVKFLVKRNLT